MIRRQTSLSKNVVQFCRFLRQHNFTIGAEEEVTLLHALTQIDYSNNQIFFLALQAVLCRSRTQVNEFENLYQQYWKELGKALDAKQKRKAEQATKPVSQNAAFLALKAWLTTEKNKEEEQLAAYSLQERLSQKDFSHIPADDVDEVMRLIKAVSRRLAAQVNRRYEASNKVTLPDLRRTLRLNMRTGGELLHLLFRKPRQNRTRLVVLCDMSQSMNLYSTFLLQFLYAFQQVYSRMETFAFGTSLHYITPLLKQKDFAGAMRALNTEGDSWSGGTRIGESLAGFAKEHASRMLNKQTVIIILSDGWDTGEPELLRQSMERIKTLSKRIIWLNPLAGFPAYRPATTAMQTALPYVDVLAPVHNLDSLRKLGRFL